MYHLADAKPENPTKKALRRPFIATETTKIGLEPLSAGKNYFWPTKVDNLTIYDSFLPCLDFFARYRFRFCMQ